MTEQQAAGEDGESTAPRPPPSSGAAAGSSDEPPHEQQQQQQQQQQSSRKPASSQPRRKTRAPPPSHQSPPLAPHSSSTLRVSAAPAPASPALGYHNNGHAPHHQQQQQAAFSPHQSPAMAPYPYSSTGSPYYGHAQVYFSPAPYNSPASYPSPEYQHQQPDSPYYYYHHQQQQQSAYPYYPNPPYHYQADGSSPPPSSSSNLMGDMEGEAATDPSACYPSSSSSGDGGLSWALQGLTLAEGGGYGGNDHGYHSHYYHQQPPGPFESRGAYGGACSTAEDHGAYYACQQQPYSSSYYQPNAYDSPYPQHYDSSNSGPPLPQLQPLPPPALDSAASPSSSSPSSTATAVPPRFFVIKSSCERDVAKSLQHGVWTSTQMGNRRLDEAWQGGSAVYLFFSINGSAHFCGVAQMASAVDFDSHFQDWSEGNKWKGSFSVNWLVVKDVPNLVLRHIRLPNNADWPITHSRDTQEVPPAQGFEMMDAMSGYPSPASSLLDKLREQEQQEQATAHASSSGAAPDTRSHDHDQQQLQRRPGEGWRSRCGLLPAPPASSSTRLRQQSRRSRFRGSSSSSSSSSGSNSLSPPSQSQASSYAPRKPLYRRSPSHKEAESRTQCGEKPHHEQQQQQPEEAWLTSTDSDTGDSEATTTEGEDEPQKRQQQQQQQPQPKAVAGPAQEGEEEMSPTRGSDDDRQLSALDGEKDQQQQQGAARLAEGGTPKQAVEGEAEEGTGQKSIEATT